MSLTLYLEQNHELHRATTRSEACKEVIEFICQRRTGTGQAIDHELNQKLNFVFIKKGLIYQFPECYLTFTAIEAARLVGRFRSSQLTS